MSHSASSPSAPPRLSQVLARPRLLDRIAAMRRESQVIWLASPAGAGKTTLAASYLEACGAPALWCQLANTEADPAALFAMLAQGLPDGGADLPWLAPELAADLPRFARLFFRRFYARLPQHTIVVLDNLHQFDWERAGEVIEIALAEVPQGVNIMALSRDMPPPRLARLQLAHRIATLGWHELRFDADEAAGLARLGGMTARPSAQLLQQVDGWAAGIVMLRQHVAQAGAADLPAPQAKEELFRYFASEILQRLPSTLQFALLELGALPDMTLADIAQLHDDPAVPRLLDDLFYNNCFVDRRGEAPVRYHFHALFREFLRHEAMQRFSGAEYLAVRLRAGRLLESQGRTDEAAQVYVDAGATGALIALLEAHARTWLAAGRGQPWRRWFATLPAATVEAHPWLQYWYGVSQLHTDMGAARHALTLAAHAFVARGEVHATLAAAVALADCHLGNMGDQGALPALVAMMETALASLGADPIEAPLRLRVYSRLSMAIWLVSPDDSRLADYSARAMAMLAEVGDAAECIAAGTYLLAYLNECDAAGAQRVCALLEPHASASTLGPTQCIAWTLACIYRRLLDGRHQDALDSLDAAQALVDEFGLRAFQLTILYRRGLTLLAMNDLAGVEAQMDGMRALTAAGDAGGAVFLKTLEASYLARTGDTRASRASAEHALSQAQQARAFTVVLCKLDALLMCCYAVEGDLAAMEERNRIARARTGGAGTLLITQVEELLKAYVAMRRGDEAGAAAVLADLVPALRRSEAGVLQLFVSFHGLAGELCALALNAGIETEFVGGIVTRHRVRPPNRPCPTWPYPVAVRLFGVASVAVAGSPLEAKGKSQQQPLRMLKALLTADGGSLPRQTLAEWIWPGADSKASFKVTLHRLRKLLGQEDAVLLERESVTLTGDIVWSDVERLRATCARIAGLGDEAPLETLHELAAELLDLYRGPFCQGDGEPWIIAAREEWRERFYRAVESIGGRFEAQKQWVSAQKLFTGTLDVEPLSEMAYRGLMRCAHAQGDSVGAFTAYRRCREILASVAGRATSEETKALVVKLGLK